MSKKLSYKQHEQNRLKHLITKTKEELFDLLTQKESILSRNDIMLGHILVSDCKEPEYRWKEWNKKFQNTCKAFLYKIDYEKS